MDRPKSTTKRQSAANISTKSKVPNKKQNSDTIYLMQNQNQILKLKNQQLTSKLDSLNSQLKHRTQRVSQAQNQCQALRQIINGSIFVKDIQLQNQKKILYDKIVLGNRNIQIYQDKIADARRQVIVEEDKIPQLVADRHRYQEELRIAKMENQGSKKILLNIQQQNQQLRQRNNQLSLKKYSKQPQQRVISQEIQQRIRLIKNVNSSEKQFKKQKTAMLIADLLSDIFFQRKKICFLTIEKHGLRKAIIKKKLFLLSHIRKNYLNSIKARIMSVFREPLKPLQEQQKCTRILQEIRNRRKKAQIWRIWRNQTVKAEYSLIRKYQSHNTIQKICQVLTKSTMISSFNRIKYFNNYHQTQIAISKIYTALSKALVRTYLLTFGIFKQDQKLYEIQQQIQNSAEQHSKMLILSRMFYGWVNLMKQKRKESLSLKFKYFKRLKRIFIIRKRNVLSEMLGQSKIKINDINMKSVCFAALKQELYSVKEERIAGQHEKVSTVLKDLKYDTQTRQKFDINADKEMAFQKINKYLKRKTKQAFSIWRRQHQRIYSAQKIFSIVSFNLQKSVNYAFSRIQIRRFEKLKVSIRDKIASCDYSYNYLVQQNTHIKQVLDKKSHELQKAKFVAILQRLIRRQKQIKHKYFYKFLRSGFKCWKVKKSLQNIDHLMSKKLKIILFFQLKLNKIEKIQQQKIQYWTQRHDQKQVDLLLKNTIKGFKLTRQRNVRMRRALTGIFDRNLQISFYQAFGKMRNQSYSFDLRQIDQVQGQIQSTINDTNQNIKTTEDRIQVLTQRLKSKEETFKERKTMALYKFFFKNVKLNVGSYIHRWKNKVDEENRIMKFAKVLDVKTQSMIKTRFLVALKKTKIQLEKEELEKKLQRSRNELQNAEGNYQKFQNETKQKIEQMKAEDNQNDQTIRQYQKRTDHMNDVKVQAALRDRNKYICKVALRVWRQQKVQFLQRWGRVNKLLSTHTIRDAFQTLSQQIKTRLIRDRIKSNLTIIYSKTYKQNVGLGFHIWRNVSILRKVKQSEDHLREAKKGMQNIQAHYQMVKRKYQTEVNQRIALWKLRRFTNQWRIYTQKKIYNNLKKNALENWLRVGYSAETIKLLKKYKNKFFGLRNRIERFQMKMTQNKAKGFLKYLYDSCSKKHTITRLFIDKFCFYQLDKLKEEFFNRVKNYYREKQVSKKDRRTFCIQKVINNFEKKRKDILCQNMRIWKRNMYKMQIQRNLLKRVVRNAMNHRVRDLFYAWKLEKQARFMVRQHIAEGQVKKRQVQIKRLKKYLDDYKKQKGLLLQNEEGNFVVSPKFQQNKEKQLKRQNLLKYKFISRLILSMNGYQSSIKSWNNLQMFTKLRTKCLKNALMIRNRIQKADLYTSFKTWHNGVVQLRKMFDNMERKQLIRILNRQKDLMQMEYSKKIDVQEKVQRQLRRYKVLSYQDKRKERICAQILFREARKVKSFAFETWRKRAQEIKDYEIYDLEDRGNTKIMSMQDEVQQLEHRQRQLQQQNRMLKQAVQDALELAEMIKRITEERDKLKRQLGESNISCENLQEQNEELNNKLILAQRQAMNLLTLSGKGI